MEPMTRIGMDTIGPLSPSNGFCYIIVIIDHFSRYIELFPAYDVSAKSAADALHRHVCRFGVPMELVTDQGTQFVNDTFKEYLSIAGIEKLETIPYSKEENSIVERANKEVNRHIRNVIFDTRVIDNWVDCIPIIESLFNSSAKAPTGVAPNLIIMGRIKLPEEGILTDFHNFNNTALSARGYLDQLFKRQNDVIDAAQRSQSHINHEVIKKRNARYDLRTTPRKRKVVDMTIQCLLGKTSRWEYDQTTDPPTWKKLEHEPLSTEIQNDLKMMVKPGNSSQINETDKLDENPHLTSYKEGDYVLRARPPGKISREGLAGKYSSWWKGPFKIVGIVHTEYCSNKKHYTLLNLVNQHEYKADVMHLKPFYYDPDEVIPLNIAIKDTHEQIVDEIMEHSINEVTKVSMWKVKWEDESEAQATWEPYSTVKDVEKFHIYCYAHDLERYLPSYLSMDTAVPNENQKNRSKDA